jgi:sulfide dehydrogenase [flavocytochrome c] flavoprotein subunit
VVIGGGYGGATAAKYVRLLSDNKIDVVLIEPQDVYFLPASPTWCSAAASRWRLTTSYAGLSRNHGITVVKDYARPSTPRRKR